MEKAKIIHISLVLVIVILFLLPFLLPPGTLIVSASSSDLQAPVLQAPAAYVEDVEDYFPIDVGREWAYKVTFGEVDPMLYREIDWPMPDKTITTSSRITIISIFNKENNFLKLKVERQAATQGPLSWPIGVKLAVLQDDSGLFEDQKEMFWAIKESEGFATAQVSTYSPDEFMPDTPNSDIPRGEGTAARILFFRPNNFGHSKYFGDSVEETGFLGTDKDVPGYIGVPCMHFQRQVNVSKVAGKHGRTPSAQERDFIEDMWFAKGIGLVRLEQRVKDKYSGSWEPSMTWTLIPEGSGEKVTY